jgi:UPF0755 protein
MEDISPEQEQPKEIENPHGADFLRRKKWSILFIAAIIGVLIFFAASVFSGLAPIKSSKGGSVGTVTVKVAQGESFSEVVTALASAHLLRARPAFEIAAFTSGKAFHIQSGTYRLSAAMSGFAILRELSAGASTVKVTIAEGSNIYEIDQELAAAGVISRGDLINFKDDGDLEGKLFPDTYQFYFSSDVADVAQKFLDNFNEKAGPTLATDPKNVEKDLTLASIVEKEAPNPEDQSIIAGIMEKRMAKGMRLQIDATVCYAKQITLPTDIVDCSALTHTDFSPDSSYDSTYNTYLYAGLPPGPIGNPGIAAITAVLHPVSSSYLYYVSDPATGKIIYASTLAEQDANIKKYLSD